MNLDRVTLTGADDSVRVDDLLDLSLEFPFVEWGILVHAATNKGSISYWAPRWPSQSWIIELQDKVRSCQSSTLLSLHVCGEWVRKLLVGRQVIPTYFFDRFSRIQLNFHAENSPCNPAEFCTALQSISDISDIGCSKETAGIGRKQFIFQIDGSGGNEHLDSLWDEVDRTNSRLDAVPLFDVSGGAGVVPDKWPKPKWMENDVDYAYHGYAGGLGPENVLRELSRIEQAADNCRIWIDMETKIRSRSDSQFDLAKCRSVLEQVAPFVSK